MITEWARLRAVRAEKSQEGGYVAVMTGLLLLVFLSLAAFAVDVGQWYLVGQQEQRAADAAALAGVTSLPGDQSGAFATAQTFSKVNGFPNGGATVVTPKLDGRPTRLRVTVSRTVDNIFGPLLGVPKTTVSRTAVADYAGPVPMGSPCNEFGKDPDLGSPSKAGTACEDVTSQMWANVNSPSSAKENGDAYQSVSGCSSSVDGCSGSTNSDYKPDGYFYTVSVKSVMPSLTIQLFDPVYVNVGLLCDTNFGSGTTASTNAVNDVVTDPTTRYVSGTGTASVPEPYCTGDGRFSGTQVMNTQFTVHDPNPSSPWDPTTFPVDTSCAPTSGTPVPGGAIYSGYSGNLFNVLNQASTSTYNAAIADGFRRWTTLCTIANPVVGDYLVQVKTNGISSDTANATNHFSIRAFGSTSGENNSLSISGRERMSMYTNQPGAVNQFHLARVSSGAAGQMLNLQLFDVGDSNQSGTIYIVFPPGATGGPFTNCQGAGPASGPLAPLTGCQFPVIYNGASADHNGKWQTISVPIPADYSCDDADPRACWVRLKYDYGGGAAPHDVTSWSASIEGDPVRLVE